MQIYLYNSICREIIFFSVFHQIFQYFCILISREKYRVLPLSIFELLEFGNLTIGVCACLCLCLCVSCIQGLYSSFGSIAGCACFICSTTYACSSLRCMLSLLRVVYCNDTTLRPIRRICRMRICCSPTK